MSSYYDEDDELDIRIKRGRDQPRDPRRPPPQPVRFASPVTGPTDESTRRRRRPALREPRDGSPPEKSRPGDGGQERVGRRSSPILGERERQTNSPSPIPNKPETETGKVEDSKTGKTPVRSSSSEGDGIPGPRPSKVRNRAPSDGSWNDENTVYTPGYLEGSEDDNDLDIRVRRGRDQPRRTPDFSRDRRYGPPPPPTPSRGASRYEDDDELDIRIQRGRETPFYPERRRRLAPRPIPSRGASYYDEDDELDIRVQRGRDPSYITPTSYLERRYRPAPPPITSRDASRYFEEDDDDLDIRVRRGRDAPAPGIYPDHRYRPHRLPYYASGGYHIPGVAGIAQRRSRSRRSRSPEPVIINNRIYNDYDDDLYDNNAFPVSSRSRHRARSRSPPAAAAPVIINNRIYNDLDEDSSDGDDYRSLAPRNRSRTRTRAELCSSAAPVIVNNRIYNDYEEDDYDPPASNFGEPDFNFVPQAYPFCLSRHSKSLRGSDSVLSSVSGTSDQGEAADQELIKKESGSGRSYNILRSQYVGDGIIGRSHVVHIALMPEPAPSSLKGTSPDKNMDLEHFENNALNIAGLSQLERGAISKLLTRAKKGYDKPLQTSTKMKTRFMVPSFLQDSISEEKRLKDSRVRTISWLCVPYFCLDKYSTPSGLRASSHPMRTLLQARFGLTKKERDMKQAVRWLGNTPAEHCFYIAQVWFLIIDDSLIVSCARPSMVSLQGDSISVLPKTEVEKSFVSPNILVSTKSSLLWALPLDECQSWFAFTSHFLEYWPLQVEITYNGKSITMTDWPRILLLAKKSTIRLFVEFRPSTRVPSVRGTFMGGQASEENPNQDPNNSTRPSEASDLQNPSNPSLRPMDHRRRNKSTKESSDRIKEEFHVFTWLNASNGIHKALRLKG
ncbi:uncharacterized protein PAC_07709 [Phialocephala subalpina]|uniref:Uncharacterized protein n=1 Tax=Phialocephala subalpina TaxID=576137 RepID=A0A1L7WYJ5_9HELO|nr:uncharacterized protein PAC_07709 [Phialocephala subalpina]